MSRPTCRKRRHCDDEYTTNGKKVDNSEQTIKKLSDLFQHAELCDVHLKVGSQNFHAHKLILSMSSDVFRTMLHEVHWREASWGIIRLREDPECEQMFGEFLKYMYTGSIHLTNTSVLPVLMLADKYNIRLLVEDCKRYMASHCHADIPNTKVVSWLRYALLCNEEKLASTFYQYIKLNFDHVILSDDFLTMPQHILEELLNCQQLVVHCEFALFTRLKHWCLYNRDASRVCEQDAEQEFYESSGEPSNLWESKDQNILQMMSYVRLPIMKHGQLLAVQSDPFVKENPDFFNPRLQEALTAHKCHRFAEVRTVCGPVDDFATTSNGSRSPRSPRKNTSSTASSHSSTGSRNLVCHNSNSCLSGLSTCGAVCSAVCSTNPANEAHTSAQSETEKSNTVCGNPMCDTVCSAVCSSSPASEAHFSKKSEKSNTLCGNPVCNLCKGSSEYYIPRNYTCEDWSTFLSIDNFASFPRYGSDTFLFSTPACAVASYASTTDRHEDIDDNRMLEWQAELYPRGICFPRAKMIGIPSNFDIDESCRDIVRLAIKSRTQRRYPLRVDIVVLAIASGLADRSEYVEKMTQKTCIFDSVHTVHNIDDIVPFQELNQIGSKYLTNSDSLLTDHDSLMFASKSSCFKLKVIIKPKH